MFELLDVTEDLPAPKHCYWLKDDNEDYKALEEKVNVIKACCKSIAENYINIGFELKDIKDRKLYRVASNGYNAYADIETFALKVFGFSRTTTYNLLGVIDEFCDWSSRELKSWYLDYSYSKLVEMLPLGYMKYSKIKPNATVSEIRELKKIWDKYGFYDNQTWEEALRKGREKMAEEANAERIAKAQQKTAGLLSLLNASPETGEIVTAIEEQKAPEEIKRLSFKNDSERKTFLSRENCRKWPLYVDIPQLGLQFRRYEFANGDSLIAEFGHVYYDYSLDKAKAHEFFRLHLQTKDKPEFDCNGIAETYVLEYLKSHKDEL